MRFFCVLAAAFWLASATGAAVAAPPRPASLAPEARPAAVRSPTSAERTRANATWDAAEAAFNAGDYARSEVLFRQVLPVLGSTWGPAHIRTSVLLEQLARAVSAQGRHVEAETLYRRVVAIRRKALGGRDPGVASAIGDLANELREQGRDAEAETLMRQALDIRRAVYGERDTDTAASLLDLASLLLGQARYAEAEALQRQALDIVQSVKGDRDIDTAAVLTNLAINLGEQGRYAEAEPLLRRVLTIRRAVLGERHPDVAAALGNLGGELDRLGRYAEAEGLKRDALDIFRERLGEGHPQTAMMYDALGSSLSRQGRYAEAEPFYRRALEGRLAARGPQHPVTAESYNNLAINLNDQRRYEEAEPLSRRALEVNLAAYGEHHPHTADSYGNLAVNLGSQGRYAEAETMLRRGAAILEASVGTAHPVTAAAYHNIATALEKQGRFADAEPLYRKSLALRRDAFGGPHEEVLQSLRALSLGLALAERYAEAEPLAAEAVDMTRAITARESGGDAERAGAALDAAVPRRVFQTYLDVASRIGDAPDERMASIAFAAAQDLAATNAGQALAQAAARVAAGEAGLTDAVRRRQDLAVVARALDGRLLAAMAAGDGEVARVMRGELARATGQLASLDGEIRAKFPRYAELVSPSAIGLAELRRRLRPDEAVLLITPADSDVHLFAVSQTHASWQRMDDGAELVEKAVARLRCQVDPATCDGAAAPDPGDSGGFDRQTAYDLYRNLIVPIEPALGGVKTLYVTAGGPLSGLPLGVLVTEAPGSRGGLRALARGPWLADRYALVTLPSVSSLRALGALRAQPAVQPLAGFGDPVLGRSIGSPARGRGLAVFRAAAGGVALADPEALRIGLAPLPGTRTELNAMAAALGAPSSALRLGADATETAVKASADLGQARVVVFATHGLLPHELKGLTEPGLVFTPPASASESDDGVLTASEAARLILAADWVVLSACNTAAADGTPDGEALSGLAKSFLYAGARALLASHWRVQDDVTSTLTVQTLAIHAADPGLSKAQALQLAMRAVRTGRLPNGRRLAGWRREWAHPGAWAPFTLVSAGE